jgi:hypothetical protein
MSEKLYELESDIKEMPIFMRRLRMIMIPSVGYFTVVSKQEQAYQDFLTDALSKMSFPPGFRDEDIILEAILSPHISHLGWKRCFQSETDIFF